MKKKSILLLALFISVVTGYTQQPTAASIYPITQKVADWQIATFNDQGYYRALPAPENQQSWHNREKYHDLEWECGALYAGMFQWSTIANDPKYTDWLISIGRRNNWNLHKRMFHADDHVVGQFYLSLYDQFRRNEMLQPTRKKFDDIMSSPDAQKWHWWWCDALFMAPPVWTRLAKMTGDSRYLDYMDQQYHMTYDTLWDKKEHLFFRDKSFLNQKEKNGRSIFWSRGNGWVFGGLALMIPEFPDNWEKKDFYITIYKQMAYVLKNNQRPDGTWSMGLLGTKETYPAIETSGTSFFTFGLAWGLNNGLLDKKTFEPVLWKAWNALVKAVSPEGMLGYVQPVGAAPGESFANYTELYGSGAFLAAGSECYRYLQNKYPAASNNINTPTIFLKDAGWCWYQDPRAVIKNGKLVISGVDGQTGDIRLAVYDLQKQKALGSIVLYSQFEKDDHDAPALYARPDGSLLAVWAKHTTDKIQYYKVSSPGNYLEWSELKTFSHEFDYPTGITYSNLLYLKNEKTLYNFFRDGKTFNPWFVRSQDNGNTWGERTHFIANDVSGRQRPYAKYLQVDDSTIGVAFTDAHPRDYGNSLYYAMFRNGKFLRADETLISELKDGPLHVSKAQRLYLGSNTVSKPDTCESVPGSAWICATATNKNHFPYLGYSVYLNNSDHRYRVAMWNGKKWEDKEIAHAGHALYYYESSYTGLIAFDPEDPEQVYISTDVNPSTGKDNGGRQEIYTARIGTSDPQLKIKWEPVTSGSTSPNIRPLVVSGEGFKVLLWIKGAYHTYTNYKMDIVGKVLKRPQDKK